MSLHASVLAHVRAYEAVWLAERSVQTGLTVMHPRVSSKREVGFFPIVKPQKPP